MDHSSVAAPHADAYRTELANYKRLRGEDADYAWRALISAGLSDAGLWGGLRPRLDYAAGEASIGDPTDRPGWLSGGSKRMLDLGLHLFGCAEPRRIDLTDILRSVDAATYEVILFTLSEYRRP